jgi:hypothetical protein
MDKLPEYRMQFEPAPLGQEAVDPDCLGVRSKLGGKPNWEQNDETPKCPGCGQEMTFVAQIDSINHDAIHNPHRVDCLSDEQKFMFGDVGMIYVFFCFECSETTSIMQCG